MLGASVLCVLAACLSGRAESPQATPQIPRTTTIDSVLVSLDDASIVKEKQLLLEYSITNKDAAPVLIIIARKDSSVILRGEAKSQPFQVQGLAVCRPYQRQVTEYCMKRTPDAEWTLLEPGTPYQFRVSMPVAAGGAEHDTASARLRLLIRKGKQTSFHDVSFANIPLGE